MFRTRDFRQNFAAALHGNAILNQRTMKFEDAPHESAITVKIFRTPCARERDFEPKNDEISRMLRTGPRFPPDFSESSAREREFLQNFQDGPHGPHGSAI